jgi:hypothetical protein
MGWTCWRTAIPATPRLLREVAASRQIPLVSAGSVAAFERIAEIWRAQTWGFTIGSAFFEEKFVPGGSFENMMAVWDWLADERRMTEDEGLSLIYANFRQPVKNDGICPGL